MHLEDAPVEVYIWGCGCKSQYKGTDGFSYRQPGHFHKLEEAIVKFKLVDTKTVVTAPKALLDAIVGTKGTTKRVRVDHDADYTPDTTKTLIRGLRKHLKKLNLSLSSEAGEGYVDLWTTGQPPKERAKKPKKVEAPSGL